MLDFTVLEHWVSDGPPGPVGNGTVWGAANLGYADTIRGIVFTQVGGDEGLDTRAFFVQAHGAMGGILWQSDLGAALRQRGSDSGCFEAGRPRAAYT